MTVCEVDVDSLQVRCGYLVKLPRKPMIFDSAALATPLLSHFSSLDEDAFRQMSPEVYL